MTDNGLVYTQVTVSMVKLLKKVREELEAKERKKPRKRIRITKKEVCQELVKRCVIRQVV